MGRPKGSKNKPKESDAPAAGHNSQLNEAEKQALFLRGLGELESLLEEKNEVVADIRNHRKRIISYGFDAWEIDFALGLRKSGDAEAIERRRKEAIIAKFLNHPIGTQPDFFDEPDRTPSVDKAFEDGRVAGASGKSAQPPFGVGAEQEQAWMKGWHQGQEDLASGFKKLEPADGGAQGELEAA